MVQIIVQAKLTGIKLFLTWFWIYQCKLYKKGYFLGGFDESCYMATDFICEKTLKYNFFFSKIKKLPIAEQMLCELCKFLISIIFVEADWFSSKLMLTSVLISSPSVIMRIKNK